MKTLWLLTKRTVQEYVNDSCSHLAAAISYYVLFSTIPLLIFLVSLFGFIVRNHDIQHQVIERVVDATPLQKQEGQNLVTDTVQGVSRVSAALSVVGLLGMVWSASAMVGAVRRALNIISDAERRRPPAQQKLIDLGMVLGLGLLLVASVAATGALHALRRLSNDALGPLSTSTSFFWSVVPLLLPGVLTFFVFLLIYRLVPNVRNNVRNIWPGAVLATVLFELLKNGFAFYVAHFNNYNLVYGSLGAIMLFLLWTYLASSILLLGAELASQYGELRRGAFAEALATPTGSPVTAMSRFVRGLFLHEHDETQERQRDAKARG